MEEDNNLTNLVEENGQRWAILSQFFPGRTDVIIKNRYQLLMRHKAIGRKTIYHKPTSNEESHSVQSRKEDNTIQENPIWPHLDSLSDLNLKDEFSFLFEDSVFLL
jgi:hypothetical protein